VPLSIYFHLNCPGQSPRVNDNLQGTALVWEKDTAGIRFVLIRLLSLVNVHLILITMAINAIRIYTAIDSYIKPGNTV
jgi:hypothetical protein